ncbi:DUF1684 domain-containing protein [Saccharothrix hoggarensis]|uniref:DUF1684 domain-containing protein n=1 Tax=Saccharothrix hoggarensis TaxID=913853 RepID=A0ABW3R399_9PSEU
MTTVEDLTADWVRWHAAREEALRAPHGWLSLTALHWLDATPRAFPGVPGEWSTDGEVVRDGVREHVVAEAGSLLVDGEGDTKVEIILRTGRHGLRVRDPHAPDLVGFTGVPAFDVSPDWVVRADFQPYDPPRPSKVDGALPGLEHHLTALGAVRFTLAGRPQELVVHAQGDGAQILFHDPTNGDTTADWRVLSVPAPTAGEVVLDFNRAINLPAGLSPYGTCPKPLPENTVTVPVEAGERRFR